MKQEKRHNKEKKLSGQYEELKVLRRLNETGSEHITKLVYDGFLSYPVDMRAAFKYSHKYVPRVFMEYLGGGDMHAFIKRSSYKDEFVTERTALDIFKCLVKGVSTMNTGTENPIGTRGMQRGTFYNENPGKIPDIGEWRPYVHLDLKPGNGELFPFAL